MGAALDPAYDWPAWPAWTDASVARCEASTNLPAPSAFPCSSQIDCVSAGMSPFKVDEADMYACWQLTPERQRHEWKRARRAIISMRIRLLVAGHLVFFVGCVGLNLLSSAHVCSNFASVGCYSLLMTSVVLLFCEWLHVRFQPRLLPRFVVRNNGVTEYGDEGPLNHWDWTRVSQLRLVADRDRPEFRSLVLVTSGFRWMDRFHEILVPLPDEVPAGAVAIGECEVIGAIGLALAENGFVWQAQLGRNQLRIYKNTTL